ncbi:CAP domain-containing protein, partial [Globomyces pollinis-pini]
DECLKIHSDARTKVGLNAVTWDPVLAQSALDYATYLQNTSKWEHSQQPVGENLYMGPGPCADAARMWYAERVNYNGEKIGEGNFMSYGHFTQMLYPGLTAIGCGTTKRYVVCHYS